MPSHIDDEPLDLDMFLPQRISMLARLTQTILASALAKANLTVAHWRIFHALTHNGPSDLNAIADFTVLPQSSVSRSVARLAEQGLVTSTRAESNRRHLVVAITSKGSETLTQAVRDVREHWHQAFPLQPEEEQAFTTYINGIIDALTTLKQGHGK